MKRWIPFTLSLLWLGFIFWNSAQDATRSSELSESFMSFFGLQISVFWVRKAAHFCAFGLLGLLVGCSLHGFGVKGPGVSVLLVVLLCACVDETIQLFSLGRSAELRDVWIDFSGGATGWAALCGLRAFFWRKKE